MVESDPGTTARNEGERLASNLEGAGHAPETARGGSASDHSPRPTRPPPAGGSRAASTAVEASLGLPRTLEDGRVSLSALGPDGAGLAVSVCPRPCWSALTTGVTAFFAVWLSLWFGILGVVTAAMLATEPWLVVFTSLHWAAGLFVLLIASRAALGTEELEIGPAEYKVTRRIAGLRGPRVWRLWEPDLRGDTRELGRAAQGCGPLVEGQRGGRRGVQGGGGSIHLERRDGTVAVHWFGLFLEPATQVQVADVVNGHLRRLECRRGADPYTGMTEDECLEAELGGREGRKDQ